MLWNVDTELDPDSEKPDPDSEKPDPDQDIVLNIYQNQRKLRLSVTHTFLEMQRQHI